MTEVSERSARSLRPRTAFALTLLIGASFFGCSKASDELTVRTDSSATLTVKTIDYRVPATWRKTEGTNDEIRRAGYAAPKIGDDKEDAEALVLFYGTGSDGDRDKVWDPWFKQFDGDAKADAVRSKLDAGGNEVEVFEFLGNYKLFMGPRKPGQKTSPVQMVKEHFRMIGAVLHTKDRGNWYFRLVGPDATVQAAKSDFLAMIESAR
ncbi:MAG: hypothetical protein U0414_27775 [Polyangiaceae bacterium]